MTGLVLAASDRAGEPVVAVLASLWSPDGARRWEGLVTLAGRDTVGLLGRGQIKELTPLVQRAARDLVQPLRERLPAALPLARPWKPSDRMIARTLGGRERPRICLLPLASDSEDRAAARVVDALLRRRLALDGFDVVPAPELREAMADERTWVIGAWDVAQLERLAQKTGAQAFVIANVASYAWGRGEPELRPDVEIGMSLVSPRARVLWARYRTADSRWSTGLLGLGAVTTPVGLADEAVTALVRDLSRS
jgi:hypothetical protein